MPSIGEMRAAGQGALAMAASRSGGMRAWAARLGVEQKGTETHRGQKWERHEAAFFSSMGLSVVPQTAKAPFDLLVNGHRVDVKSSTFRDYGYVTGYLFNGLKNGSDSDFFDFVCVEGGLVLHRFIIPSAIACTRSLTITQSSIDGIGKRKKWFGFKDATALLLETRAVR